MDAYQQFLESKRHSAEPCGFRIDRERINPKLRHGEFGFQADSGGVYTASSRTTSLGGNTAHEKTAAAVNGYFPTSGPKTAGRIAARVREKIPGATDDEIARAVHGAYKGKSQHSAGLFLETVPLFLLAEASQAADPIEPIKPQPRAYYEKILSEDGYGDGRLVEWAREMIAMHYRENT